MHLKVLNHGPWNWHILKLFITWKCLHNYTALTILIPVNRWSPVGNAESYFSAVSVRLMGYIFLHLGYVCLIMTHVVPLLPFFQKSACASSHKSRSSILFCLMNIKVCSKCNSVCLRKKAIFKMMNKSWIVITVTVRSNLLLFQTGQFVNFFFKTHFCFL